MLLDHPLRRFIDFLQLYYYQQNRNPNALAAKTVEVYMVTEKISVLDQLVESIDVEFKFEAVVHELGTICYFGFNITQHEDLTCTLDGEDRHDASESVILLHLRLKRVNNSLNEIEKSKFLSLHSSLGWLGITIPLFCVDTASHLQQCLPVVHNSDMTSRKPSFVGRSDSEPILLLDGRAIIEKTQFLLWTLLLLDGHLFELSFLRFMNFWMPSRFQIFLSHGYVHAALVQALHTSCRCWRDVCFRRNYCWCSHVEENLLNAART